MRAGESPSEVSRALWRKGRREVRRKIRQARRSVALSCYTSVGRRGRGRHMASVDAVADYILGKIVMDEGDSITNLKLQKIVYYCQAWSLAIYDGPLFDDEIEAWVHGPAVMSLYQRFKDYGNQAIDTSRTVTHPMVDLDDQQRDLIDQVWDSYGPLSGMQLRRMTHREDPWKNARGDCGEYDSCRTAICETDMRDYYRRRLED